MMENERERGKKRDVWKSEGRRGGRTQEGEGDGEREREREREGGGGEGGEMLFV